eukprot:gene8930-9852_t
MEDQSEPVQVFVRIRPEIEEGLGNSTTANSSNGISNGQSSNKVTPEKIIKSTTYGNLMKINTTVTVTNNNYCVTSPDDHTIRLMPPDGCYASRKSVSAVDDKIYHFDHVFNEATTQEQIYETVAEQVLATVRGYNTTIFAYGVTGSGKSYTMTGNKQAPGIIPRAIGDIFKSIDQAANEEDVYFFVRLSYVELYNNTFRNLLEHVAKETFGSGGGSGSSNKTINSNMSMSGFFTELDDLSIPAAYEAQHGPTFAYGRASSNIASAASRSEKIEVRESQSAGVFLSGPNLRFPVTSAVEAFQLIAKGNKYRATGATNCNEESSRSHAILTFHVESRISTLIEGTAKSEIRIGKIHLVDLAGSERLTLSGADGDTLVETKSINSSLTALGDVLSALSKNASILMQQQKQSKSGKEGSDRVVPTLVPVPYRNSKLTHLLKDSLGGNSKTIMITTIRKTNEYYQQTAVSLMYASRAKKVRNRTTVNRNVIGDSGIFNIQTEFERITKSLEERTLEFERLRMMQLKDAKENSVLKARLQEMKMANEQEKRLLEQQVGQLISSQTGQLQLQKEKISQLQLALQDELTQSQNRIAEQEQEIKWLKKALDESNQAMPKDQMEKMQHLIDVWQSQAKTAHMELSIVLRQAEELKGINTNLEEKIRELEASNKQLTDEADASDAEIAELTSKYTLALQEKENLDEVIKSSKKAYDELRLVITDQIKVNTEREQVLKENTKLIQSLEVERVQLRDRLTTEGNVAKEKQQELTNRMNQLEKENMELTNKLTTTIRSLEQKTQDMVEDANSKISKLEDDLVISQQTNQQLLQEIENNKKLVEEEKSSWIVQMEQKEKSLADIEAALRRELQNSSKLSNQIMNLQKENSNMKDKNQQQQKKSQERFDSLAKRLQEKEDVIHHQEKDLQELRDLKEQEKNTLLLEFERILQEKRSQQLQEIQELRKQYDNSNQLKELDYQKLLEEEKEKYQEKERQFQEQLQATEVKVREMIEKEIEEGMMTLQERHRIEIITIKEQMMKDQEEAMKSLKEVYQKEKQDALHDQEVLLAHRYEIISEEKLDAQKRLLNTEKEEICQKIRQQCNQDMFKKLEELELLKDHHGEEMKKELESYLTSQFTREKKDLIEKMERNQKLKIEEERMKLEKIYEDQYHNKEEELMKELEDNKKAYQREKEEALTRLKVQLLTEMSKKMKEIEEQKELENQEQQAILISEYRENAIKEKKDALDRLEKAWKLKWDEELRRLDSLHENKQHDNELRHVQEIEELTKQFLKEKEEAITKVKTQGNMELQRKLQECIDSHEKALSELRQELEVQLTGQYSLDMKEALVKQESQLRQRYEDQLRRQEESLIQQREVIETTLNDEIQQLRHNLQIEKEGITRLKLIHNNELTRRLKELEDMKDQYLLEEKEHLKQEYNREKELALERQEKIFKQKLDDALRKIEERYQQQLQEQTDSLQEKIEAERVVLLSEKQEAITKVKTQGNIELQRKLQECIDSHEKALSELRQELEVQLTGQYSLDMKEALVKQESQLRQRYEDQLRRQEESLIQQRNELEENYRNEIESLRRNLQTEKMDTIAVIRGQHIQELNKRLEDLEQAKDKFCSEQLTILQEQHEIERQSLTERLERQWKQRLDDEIRKIAQQHIRQMQSQEDDFNDRYEELRRHLQNEQNEVLVKMKNQYENELTKKIQELIDQQGEQWNQHELDLKITLEEQSNMKLKEALINQERSLKQVMEEKIRQLVHQHDEDHENQEKYYTIQLEEQRQVWQLQKEEAINKIKLFYNNENDRKIEEMNNLRELQLTALRHELEEMFINEKKEVLEKQERLLKQKFNDQMNRLENQKQKEKDELIELHQQELQHQQDEFELLKLNALNTLEKTLTIRYENEKKMLLSNYEESMENLRHHLLSEKDHDLTSILDEQKKEWTNKMNEQDRLYLKRIQEIEDKQKDELIQIEKDYQNKQQQVIETLQNEHEIRLIKVKQEIEKKQEIVLDQMKDELTRQYQLTLSQMKEDHMNEITDLNQSHSNTINQMKQEMENEYEKSLNQVKDNLTQNHQLMLIQMKEELVKEHQQVITNLQQEMERKQKYLISQLQQEKDENHNHFIEHLQDSLEKDHQQAMKVFKDEIESSYKKMMKEYQEKHIQEINTIHQNYQQQLDMMNTKQKEIELSYQNQMNQLKKDVEKDKLDWIKQEEDHWQSTRRSLEKSYQEELEEKENQLLLQSKEMKELIRKHREEMTNSLFQQQNDLFMKSKDDLDKVRLEQIERERIHQNELTQLTHQHAMELRQQRSLIEESHEKVLSALKDELLETRRKLTEALDFHTIQSNEELSAKLELRNKLEESYKKKEEILQYNLIEEKKHLEESYQYEIEKLQQIITKLKKIQEDENKQSEITLQEKIKELEFYWKDKIMNYQEESQLEINRLNTNWNQSKENLMKFQRDFQLTLEEKDHHISLLEGQVKELQSNLLVNKSNANKNEIEQKNQFHQELQDLLQQKMKLEQNLKEQDQQLQEKVNQYQILLKKWQDQEVLKDNLQKQLEMILKQHEEEKSSLHSMSQLNTLEQLEKLEKKYKEELKLFQTRQDDQIQQLQDLHQKELWRRDEKVKEVEEKVKEWQEKVQQRDLVLVTTIEEWQKKVKQEQQKIKELTENYQKEKDMKEGQYRNEIHSLTNQHHQEMEQFIQQQLQENQLIRLHYQDEIKRLQDEYQDEINKMKEKSNEYHLYKMKKDQECQNLTENLTSTEYQLNHLNTKYKKLQDDYQEILLYHEDITKKYKEETEYRVQTLLQQHDIVMIENKEKENIKNKLLEEEWNIQKKNYHVQIEEKEKKLLELSNLIDKKCQECQSLQVLTEQQQMKLQSQEQELEESSMTYTKNCSLLEKKIKLIEDELITTRHDYQRQVLTLQSTLNEKDIHYQNEMKKQLEEQQTILQDKYLTSIKEQMNIVVQMIKAQADGKSTDSHFQQLQSRFLDLVQDLPDLWQQKHGEKFLLSSLTSSSRHGSGSGSGTDGDVQGIRTIIRSKGEDLLGDYWHSIAMSILPLHRAISGLHFHGNHKLLMNTLETLLSLGADIHAIDHNGNTVLHKAIQICTSKNILQVLHLLLTKGGINLVQVINKEGETALHVECKRLRSASIEVIDTLATMMGDKINLRNKLLPACSPLTLVLIRGASTTNVGSQLIGQNAMGAFWDGTWSSPQQHVTQLHLLLAAYPPLREDSHSYYQLLRQALGVIHPGEEDDRGRNGLFIFCEVLAQTTLENTTTTTATADCQRILKLLLDQMAIQQIPIGGSDRTGRTIFDIAESIPRSALSSDAVSPPLSSNIMTASSTAAGGGSGPYHHHHPHHRVSSAVVASSVRPNAAITTTTSSSLNSFPPAPPIVPIRQSQLIGGSAGEAEAKAAATTVMGSSSSSNRRRGSNGGSIRSYFDEEEEEVASHHTLASRASAASL